MFDDGYWIENDRIYLDDDGSLVISDAKIEDDNGKYICKAQNKFGKATASAFVVVTKKTILNTEGKDIPFAAGSSVTFDCEAEVRILICNIYIFFSDIFLQGTMTQRLIFILFSGRSRASRWNDS